MVGPLPGQPGAGLTAVHVLGVRHHGPGSARAVRAALDAVDPDVVLIEGAPELDAVAACAAAPGMVAPVAGLVYALDRPRLASFYPMASFSPEWEALRWALLRGRAVRFVDLPAANALALDGRRTGRGDDDDGGHAPVTSVRADPLGALAAAAGYDDPEAWWEDLVEHRSNGLDVFAAVTDAMRSLRDSDPGPPDESDARREAAMRRAIRDVLRATPRAVAVVCGAWHAPALVPEGFPAASGDTALLRGLPRVKVAATWVPWTSARLARASGYGAGVTSPAWYAHLHRSPDDVVTRWMADAARLLRGEDLHVSPAAVIDAVRLAESLAVLRGRPVAGLAEVREAAEVVLCAGAPAPLRLVERTLLVGDELGSVPPDTPMVPLARDLEQLRRRLRLTPSATPRALELDLRRAPHRERSRLLHRLALLGIPWGEPADSGRTTGTFKETWVLTWAPELSVAVIDAGAWGATVEEAAAAYVADAAARAGDLATLTELVEAALLADLPEAVTAVVEALAVRAAELHDTPPLMDAVVPLARIRRYGDVRRADSVALDRLLRALVARVVVGLPVAAASLDDEGATELRGRIDAVHGALAVLDDTDLREEWLDALAGLAGRRGVHGAVSGRAVRLLLDAGRLAGEDARRRMALTLSRAEDPPHAAAWLESFLLGDALLLVHDRALLDTIDAWLGEVPASTFADVLPVLRRAFSRYTGAERRLVGERVAAAGRGAEAHRGDGGGDGEQTLDEARAALVEPLVLTLLAAGGRGRP